MVTGELRNNAFKGKVGEMMGEVGPRELKQERGVSTHCCSKPLAVSLQEISDDGHERPNALRGIAGLQRS